MTSMMLTALGPLAIAIGLGVIVRELLRTPHRRFLGELVRFERNRNRFGAIRTDLMALAREGRANPRSTHFGSIYRFLSLLMRQPDRHGDAVRLLLNLPAAAGAQQAEKPTRDEAELALRLARELDALCRDYSRTYRALCWFVDTFGNGRDAPPLWVLVHIEKSRNLQKVTPVREARERLEQWGNEALAAA